jgi:hypothetical protein
MSKNKPIIVWEKWTDPFGDNQENIEWPGYDDSPDDEFTQPQHIKQHKVNVMVTNMGIIPYNEYTDCSKIFNFWIGHTNFNITSEIAELIESVEGVETLDIFTRYRFRVSFGKAFNDREIMDLINKSILEKLS